MALSTNSLDLSLQITSICQFRELFTNVLPAHIKCVQNLRLGLIIIKIFFSSKERDEKNGIFLHIKYQNRIRNPTTM